MDFMEIALCNAAERDPVGITNCHFGVVKWLLRANLITQQEHDAIGNFVGDINILMSSILVRATDPVVDRAALLLLPPGNVLGFYAEGVLEHSMIKTRNDRLAGVNNAMTAVEIIGNGAPKIRLAHPGNKYSRMQIDELNWRNANSEVLAGHRKTNVIHYQHPGVVADRISKKCLELVDLAA